MLGSPHCKFCRNTDHREATCPWNGVDLGFPLIRKWMPPRRNEKEKGKGKGKEKASKPVAGPST